MDSSNSVSHHRASAVKSEDNDPFEHALTYGFRPGLTLPSDHRFSKPPPPKLSSAVRKNYISSYRQDVLPLNQPRNPVQSTSQNGHSQSGTNSTSPALNVHRTTPPPPVFHNVSDLAAHHGIPQFLPPAPRTILRRTPSESSMTQSPEIEDFSGFCNDYLSMISEPSVDSNTSSNNRSTVSQPPAPEAGQEAVWELMEVLFQASANNNNDFLTSPMESPFDDFLSTPGQKQDDYSELTSPLIADNDGGSFDSPLFHDIGRYEPPSAPKQPTAQASLFPPAPNFEGMYTLSPATPALDPSSFIRPNPHPIPHRSNVPNGTRKNVTPETLVPLDAPVQPRKYLTESSTSRKEEPASHKRAHSSAFGDEEEQEIDPGLDSIAAKRLQNTLAARRSRKRKLEYQRELETALDAERAEKEQWRARAVTLEALLTSHGVTVPHALNF